MRANFDIGCCIRGLWADVERWTERDWRTLDRDSLKFVRWSEQDATILPKKRTGGQVVGSQRHVMIANCSQGGKFTSRRRCSKTEGRDNLVGEMRCTGGVVNAYSRVWLVEDASLWYGVQNQPRKKERKRELTT